MTGVYITGQKYLFDVVNKYEKERHHNLKSIVNGLIGESINFISYLQLQT